MKSYVFLASLAAFSLVSGMAGAVTLKNTGKGVEIVSVDVGGKKDVLKLMPGQIYDSKDKDASFIVGNNKPVQGKGKDNFILNSGKITADTSDTQAAETPVTPAAGR